MRAGRSGCPAVVSCSRQAGCEKNSGDAIPTVDPGRGAAIRPAAPRLLVGAVADYQSLPLTTADAERGEAAPGVAAAHLVQKGDEDPAAAGSDRMPKRDRPAMGVDPFGVDVQLPEHGERLRRERLIELEQIDVA